MRRVVVHIDQLALHGLAPGDARAAHAALHGELAALLARPGTPLSARQLQAVQLPALRLDAAASPAACGRAAAGAVAGVVAGAVGATPTGGQR